MDGEIVQLASSSNEHGSEVVPIPDVGENECWPCEPQVSAFTQRQNAGYMASRTGGRPPPKPQARQPGKPGGPPPPCPSCNGKHADVRTCPGTLARQDTNYNSTGAACFWKCFGKYTCGGNNHLSRHHLQQWQNENPGKTAPKQEKGSGGGKGKGKGKGKGRGKGKFKGRKVIRAMFLLEDGTEVPEEEYGDIEWDEGEEEEAAEVDLPADAQNPAVQVMASPQPNVPASSETEV